MQIKKQDQSQNIFCKKNSKRDVSVTEVADCSSRFHSDVVLGMNVCK